MDPNCHDYIRFALQAEFCSFLKKAPLAPLPLLRFCSSALWVTLLYPVCFLRHFVVSQLGYTVFLADLWSLRFERSRVFKYFCLGYRMSILRQLSIVKSETSFVRRQCSTSGSFSAGVVISGYTCYKKALLCTPFLTYLSCFVFSTLPTGYLSFLTEWTH